MVRVVDRLFLQTQQKLLELALEVDKITDDYTMQLAEMNTNLAELHNHFKAEHMDS